MYKKRNDKLFFGPIWDFDLTLGNRTDGKGDVYDAWHIRQSSWFERFFEDPLFDDAFKNQWNSLKMDGSFCNLFNYANARVVELSRVQENNFSVWDISTIPLWGRNNATYQTEADRAIDWLVNRFEWMDAQINPLH